MTRSFRSYAWVVALAVVAAAPVGAQGKGDVVDRAMRDEMARSMTQLRLGTADQPYFIAYRMREVRAVSAAASYGSLLSGDDVHQRILDVTVRVGSYAFDNTNSFGAGMGMNMIGGGGEGGGDLEEIGGVSLPLDDNYVELRRQMWLATDAAYKRAIVAIAGKRAALMNRTRTDSMPDFSHEDTTVTVERDGPPLVDRGRVEVLARTLSRLRDLEDEATSQVTVEASDNRVRYLNSEGTSYTTSGPLLMVTARASTQATDGMPLSDAVTVYTRRVDSLPSTDRLTAEIRSMVAGLDSARSAPVAERYSGPVLFDGRAAAQVVATIFGPGLTPRRKIVFPNAGMSEAFGRLAGPSLVDRIGSRVLPDFLSVVDDPTRSVYGGTPLLGGYVVDVDGVRGRPTRVIEGGILKGVLTTRTPVMANGRSTGNNRGVGAGVSNLIVEARDGVSDSALTGRLLALVKSRGLPYGIIVRDLGGGGGVTMQDQMQAMFMAMSGGGGGRQILGVYKIYPDGHQERVRGAHLTGLTPESFRDIVAVSSATTVYTGGAMPEFSAMMMAAVGGDMSARFLGLPVATYVVPSLLFEDATLTPPSEEFPKPPFSAPPAIGQQ